MADELKPQPKAVTAFQKLHPAEGGGTTNPFQKWTAEGGDFGESRIAAMTRHPSATAQEAPSAPESDEQAPEAPEPHRAALSLVRDDADALAAALDI